MSYSIRKDLTEVNKGKKGANKPKWIIFHFVGASGQAANNAKYFKSVERGASAHYFVDPKEIVQVVEDDTPAWHIGDGSRSKKGTHNGYVKPGYATNNNSIGIEVCQDTSTGDDAWEWEFHPESLNKTVWLIKHLQEKYDIPNENVIRHFDATTKPCPGNWKKNDWVQWWAFKDRLEGVNQPVTPNTPNTAPKPTPNQGKTIDQLAQEVIDGVHGSGEVRKNALGSKYQQVQDRVNEILSGKKPTSKPVVKPSKSIDDLAKEVIRGLHGNGDARKKSLGKNYAAVQVRVAELLQPPKPKPVPVKSISQLADEVMRGLHGHGEARKKSLGKNFDAVQKEINRRLK